MFRLRKFYNNFVGWVALFVLFWFFTLDADEVYDVRKLSSNRRINTTEINWLYMQ